MVFIVLYHPLFSSPIPDRVWRGAGSLCFRPFCVHGPTTASHLCKCFFDIIAEITQNAISPIFITNYSANVTKSLQTKRILGTKLAKYSGMEQGIYLATFVIVPDCNRTWHHTDESTPFLLHKFRSWFPFAIAR